MARILLAWELGEGLGHLTVLRPVAERFLEEGHQIHLASRELTAAETVFGDLDVNLYQAPLKLGKPVTPISSPAGYSQILHNCGFETSSEIIGRLKAWDRLLDLTEPALVVCDHSPTVLAALRGRNVRVATVGTGFVNPPVGKTMPALSTKEPVSEAALAAIESGTLAITNDALVAVGKPKMDCLSDLYRRADCTLITSFKELDHFW